MTDALIVFCTCSNRDEALKLAQAIVTDAAAACVNIIPAVESVYRWQGKIETAQEVLLPEARSYVEAVCPMWVFQFQK